MRVCAEQWKCLGRFVTKNDDTDLPMLFRINPTLKLEIGQRYKDVKNEDMNCYSYHTAPVCFQQNEQGSVGKALYFIVGVSCETCQLNNLCFTPGL